MKVLLIAAGTRGDVEPFAHLARQLDREGHHVDLAVPDGSGVDLAGVTVQSLGVDYAAVVAHQGVSPWRAVRSMRSTVRPLMRTLFTTAARAVRDQRPDVVVHHPKVLSAPLAAEASGIPHIVAELVPVMTPTREFPAPGVVNRDLGPFNRLTYVAEAASRRMFAKELAAAAHDVGQTWARGATYDKGSIVAVSPHLVARPSDWPDHVRLTGPWLGGRRDVADESISRFVDRGEFVYMGFGSMSDDHAESRARALIGAARAASLRVVCATGWGGLSVPADLRGDDLLVLGSAPHDYLFSRAAAVIHHGGAGTVHAAARAGAPQLVVPFFGDQPFWASVVARTGLGPRRLDRRRLRASEVARSLERLEPFRARARSTARDMAAEQGARRAAELIEAVS